MKKLYILSCVILLFSCSREEWLDITPKGKVIPSKTADFRLLLDQVDRGGRQLPGTSKISPGFGTAYSIQSFMSDDFVLRDDTHIYFGEETINTYTWENQIFEVNEEDRDWANLYGQIYVANFVLEEVMDADGTMDEKLTLEAEAKVHRAFAYLSLVNLYGLHYHPSTAASNLAVPLRLTTSLTEDLSRASVESIYKLIVEDTESALEFLPDTPESQDHIHRPSKAAAYALLARTYLYMGAYEKSRDAAHNALLLQNSLLDLNTLPSSNWNGAIVLPEHLLDPQLIWFKEAVQTYGLYPISDEVINLYDPNDERLRYYSTFIDFFGIPAPGYILATMFNNGGERYAAFTVPEMYITKAECNARLGFVSDAVNDLNTLLINRLDTNSYVPITSTDQNEVINLAKKERRLEFVAQGLRFFDIKRYNAFDNANIIINHDLLGETNVLQPGSNNWAIPIAQKYILETPEIEDNVRD